MQEKNCYPYKEYQPQIADDVFLAPGSRVIGNVVIGKGASIWYNAVLRGDMDRITIGEGSNIQDCCAVHVDDNTPTTLGKNVTVGHGAILHGCTIGDGTLVGMGATILNNAKIGPDCLIAAGTLVPEGKEIPAGSVVMGVPGKVVRKVTEEVKEKLKRAALLYQRKSREYKESL